MKKWKAGGELFGGADLQPLPSGGRPQAAFGAGFRDRGSCADPSKSAGGHRPGLPQKMVSRITAFGSLRVLLRAINLDQGQSGFGGGLDAAVVFCGSGAPEGGEAVFGDGEDLPAFGPSGFFEAVGVSLTALLILSSTASAPFIHTLF